MVGVGSTYGSAAEERAAELLSWAFEGDGVAELRRRGLPEEVVALVERKAELTHEIARLEDEEGRVVKELIEAVEGL